MASQVLILPGLFGLLHGYAHVAEMPAGASLATYASGFVLATVTLHAAGLVVGSMARHLALSRGATRFAGAAITAIGGAMLAGLL